MLKFYTHEQEKEYGVVGIQIKLVKQQLIISRILFKIKSSRNRIIILFSVLSHHRTYRSVYGGSIELIL